jgi:ABC-type nitrate/sulfonate/bicarbonate transport system substrate-binding protein
VNKTQKALPLEIITFPGAPNLPIFVARERGYFAEHSVAMTMSHTPNSAHMMQELVKGRYKIGGTAFDNVVAYQEGQGAAALDRQPDLFAFMGATQIELSLIVAPEIESYAQLKDRSLALDALTTGFAFVLYHMLANAGLGRDDCELVAVGATPQRWQSVRSGEHAGTITIEPFTSIARAQGFRVLETSTDVLPAYQGGCFAASRSWARAHSEAIKGFIRGYLDGLAWTLDPANRTEAADVLIANMAEIKPHMAEAVMTSLLSPRSGLTPRGEMIMDGVRAVLDLRSRFGGGGPLTIHDKFIDLSYYGAAINPL